MSRLLSPLSRAELPDLDAAFASEWLVTNGIGGYASGTVAQANTRRYHGLLVAALTPPLGRTVMVAKLEILVEYLDHRVALTSNEFADGTINPQGVAPLLRFELDGRTPVWTYSVADALIEQRVWMAAGENSTYVRLRVLRASSPIRFSLSPMCTYRDYHSHSHGQGWEPRVVSCPDGCEVRAFEGAHPFRITTKNASFFPESSWYWNYRHRAENRRGLDDSEDLLRVGSFEASAGNGENVTLCLATDEAPLDADHALAQLKAQEADLLRALPESAPAFISQLVLAADQFIVQRGTGHTVIAGYPWFGDWGRDTMIALPGLTIATGRFDIAASILRTFAKFVSEGMLPNRFPDSGETPEYNTVDATLWYFHAVGLYVDASNDRELARELYPVLADIIEWHLRGTRYGIGVAEDGLLAAGVAGVQLTWMDARVGDQVITPRIGKPVEINALWYRALRVVQALANQLGDAGAARRMEELADKVRGTFDQRFFSEDDGYLYDVIDSPSGDDASLRPNQIIAVSLAPDLLNDCHRRAVVDAVARKLWTPVGLRSLGEEDASYVSHYGGESSRRDAAYHQGTVWSWLLGPFARAHFNTYGNREAARGFLEPIAFHLNQTCYGSISEIFSGAAPHEPEGCFAQAWSVAEVLSAWLELNDNRTSVNRGETE